ncbi:uncharacterized protein PHA67_001183 [Liasis olivaceus]
MPHASWELGTLVSPACSGDAGRLEGLLLGGLLKSQRAAGSLGRAPAGLPRGNGCALESPGKSVQAWQKAELPLPPSSAGDQGRLADSCPNLILPDGREAPVRASPSCLLGGTEAPALGVSAERALLRWFFAQMLQKPRRIRRVALFLTGPGPGASAAGPAEERGPHLLAPPARSLSQGAEWKPSLAGIPLLPSALHAGQPRGPVGPNTQAPPASIPSHLLLSLFNALCCCLPLGIGALICSLQVKGALRAGDTRRASRCSSLARKVNLLGVMLGIVLLITMVVVYALHVYKNK